MATFFNDVPTVPIAEVFRLSAEFKSDSNPTKVNLGVGVYRTDEGKPWVLPVVSSTINSLAADKTLNHEYLPIDGMREFCDVSTRLILGPDSPAIVQNRVYALQVLSGTGGLRIMMDFLLRFLPSKVVYTSKPTWGNHATIAQDAGFTDRRQYRYYDDKTHMLDLNGMLEDLQNAPEGSLIILHGCAHNPTGVDPSNEQWKEICRVIKEKRLFPLLDYAYLGLVSGDIDTDAWAVRHFINEGLELVVAQSFAKNFGLYGQRIGNAFFVVNDAITIEGIRSQMKCIVRRMYSNPPLHGARIVTTVLGNPALTAEWKECVQTMAKRVRSVREMLYQKMRENATPGNWEHIIKQNGFFTFTGLKPKHVKFLLAKYHIYMLGNGRINMCAVTTGNVDYVAKAFDDAVRNAQE